MRLENYPAIFNISDSSAIESRKKHFLLLRTRLALLLLASSLSVCWAYFKLLLIAYLMCFCLILLVIMRIWDQKNYPKLWYESRAIAESVKEETWKFVMKAYPYNLSKTESDEEFLVHLEKIREIYRDTSSRMQSRIDDGTQITQEMHELRSATFDVRKEFYFENRIRNQQIWYSRKAGWNQKREKYWDCLRFVLEFLAVVFALFLVTGVFDTSIIGVFTTSIGIVISWDQANRHEELYKIYNYTSQSLSLINSRTNLVKTESDLSELVLAGEQEISKEHSTWLSRRIT